MTENIIYFGGYEINTDYQYLTKYDKVAEMQDKKVEERRQLAVTFMTDKEGRMKVKLSGNRLIPKEESNDYIDTHIPPELYHRADVTFTKDGKVHVIKGLGGNLHRLEGKLRDHKRKLGYKEAYVKTDSRRRASLKGYHAVTRGKAGRFTSKENK